MESVNMRTHYDDAVSLSFPIAPAKTVTRTHAGAARGITGRVCVTGDLVLLSLVLIYLALWAGGIQESDSVFALLSMRISVGHFAMLALCWVVWYTVFSFCGLYAWQQVRSTWDVVGRVALATGFSALVAGRVIATQWHHDNFLQNTARFWLIGASCVLALRAAIAAFHVYVRPHFRHRKDVVVVGSDSRAIQVCQDLSTHPEWKYRFLGFVAPYPWTALGAGDRMLGRITDLEDILMKQVVDEVVIALSAKSQYAAIEKTIAICQRLGVQVQYCEDLFETSQPGRCQREEFDHRKVVLKMVHDDYRRRVKRALDIAGAVFGLIVLAPLILLVAVLIKRTSKGPVFFRQERHGLNKRTFYIYKFRTMVENAEAGQAALEDRNENSGPVFKIFKDPRVTRIGSFLRRTSIDEIPQLFNILKGEMSFVGPRPLNKRDVSRFPEAWLMRRFSVTPGLTCLWQISGRSNISFDRWIELDLHYIDHWSLQMDLKILAKTFPVVLKGTGAA
jgi:exopolysaccharide biosynthesis polyprenyl glycosylphosphotransferase